MNQPDLHPDLKRIQRISLIVGGVALLIGIVGAFIWRAQFFEAYLLGFALWMQIALGHLGVLLIHHITGGKWGYTIRRFLETGMMTLPVMALFFIPIIIGMGDLYSWTDPAVVAESHLLQLKQGWWLNTPFFIFRTVLYFVIWIGVGYLLNRWSLRQDETGDQGINERLKNFSAIGMILAVLASTFAAFDWMMSADPLWYSSMYGVIYMAGQAIAAIAVGIILSNFVRKRDEAFDEQATIYIFNDLGNFLLAFTSFWAYVAFSQYLILYSANLPETITWYVVRGSGGWQFVGMLLVVFGFAVPFLILLSRRNKRNIPILITLSIMALVMRFVDLFWIIIPMYYPDGFYFHWLYLVVPVGIGGIWVALYIRLLKGKAVLAFNDLRYQKSADHDAHDAPEVSGSQLQEA
jgi:hypothetical protein